MTLPQPSVGLVIYYSYLWATEYAEGREDGHKDRPCAIVAATQMIEERLVVTVVPITHTAPHNPDDAVLIPRAIKIHLGLDDHPSWIVTTETNDFLWPGTDLRPIGHEKSARYHYGVLPPRFFNHIRDKILQAHISKKLNAVPRTE